MQHLRFKKLGARWLTVALFAVAMAWVESAVVFDLRAMVARIEPYQPEPLPLAGTLGLVELVRELATMIMLLAVGILAGHTWRNRLAYTAVAFGVWDIFYYVFLKLMCGWPHSLLDWDILFLLPLPWWGPVLTPMMIAALMVAWGTLVTQGVTRRARGLCNAALVLGCLGAILAFYTFVEESVRVADQGVDALRRLLPAQFDWPLFGLAFVLMALPILLQGRELWLRNLVSDRFRAWAPCDVNADPERETVSKSRKTHV
jgi:hypothetical protein